MHRPALFIPGWKEATMADDKKHDEERAPEDPSQEESEDLSMEELSDVSGGVIRRIVMAEDDGDDDDGTECTTGFLSTCKVRKTSIETWCSCAM